MPFTNKSGEPIERKAVAAPWATFIATQLVLWCFNLWPAFRSAFPGTADQLGLVSVAATVLTALAAYLAPHTPRLDLEMSAITQFLEQNGYVKRAELANSLGIARETSLRPMSIPESPPESPGNL